MKNLKRIIALLGVVILVALYIITFVLAFLDHSDSMQMFKASIVATVIIPTLLWIYSYMYQLIKKYSGKKQSEDSIESEKTPES